MVRLYSILTIRIIRLISIHFAILRTSTQILIYFSKFGIFTLISVRFINFRINRSISIHITRKLKILRVRILRLLCLDKLDKLIFQKRELKALFSANHWAAVCRTRKNAAFWFPEKIFVIHFVRINKLNVFTGDLPTEN